MHFLKSLPIDVFVLEVSEQSESIIKDTSLMHGFVNSFLGGGGWGGGRRGLPHPG